MTSIKLHINPHEMQIRAASAESGDFIPVFVPYPLADLSSLILLHYRSQPVHLRLLLLSKQRERCR